ncbi:multidrug resistance protein stp [Methylomusa anaerophila]|uniref:Multidrug resistance protein stp n=2 Tax=Methylomusa anaerophila TaxID=1930071 RepID=A0A348AN48_9FIRM|nr:multidrug resistance protein stp [Methylomusa anaerophila]
MNQQVEHSGYLVAGLSIAIFMSSLDTSVVNVVLPTLVTTFKTSFAAVQWVVLSYLLVVASLIVGAGKLGDVIGKKKLYIGGLATFTVASALCGMSATIIMLIISRALQGVGAAIVMALGFAIAQEWIHQKDIIRSMTILTAMVSLGFAVGPTLGGMLIHMFGWRAIFYINVPFGITAIFLVMKALPSFAEKKENTFDWKGTLILAVTLTTYICAMTLIEMKGFASGLVLSLLAASILELAIFIWMQSRVAHPLVMLNMFRDRLLTTSLLSGVFVYSNLMCAQILSSFFLARVDGFSETQIGIALSVGPLTTTLLGFVAGVLAKRFQPRKIMVVGIGIMIFGNLAMTTMAASDTYWDFCWRMALINGGLALFQTPNNLMVMGAAKSNQRGVVSGLLALGRSLGQITGASVMSSVFAQLVIKASKQGNPVATAEPVALITAYHQTFYIIMTYMILTAMIAALGVIQSEKRESAV